MAELNWRNSESFNKPEAIDSTSSPNGVYVRRFITEVTTEDGETKYTYKEAFLTQEEYNQYQLMNTIAEQVLKEDTSDACVAYKAQLDTPVLYEVNGHYYKPKWAADIYESLVSKGEKFPDMFPITIWDATEEAKNAVEMTIEELRALTTFLGKVQEKYYYAYKLAKN